MSNVAAAVRNSMAVCAIGAGVLSSSICSANLIIFSAGGDDTTASIQPTVDAFRAALGNPNNGATASSFPSGRREINWDGGGATNGAASGTPLNAFLGRGAQFLTPGTGFLQAPLTNGTDALDDINPSYATTFRTFSPLRLFTPLGSTITDTVFSLPGSNGSIPATVGGFGAIFSDVDLANITSIELFAADGSALLPGPLFVPQGAVANASLSFLGVVADAGERIARVRIVTGNAALGAGVNDGAAGVDLVVMDDFLFAEPRALSLPSTLGLLGMGLLGLALRRRR